METLFASQLFTSRLCPRKTDFVTKGQRWETSLFSTFGLVSSFVKFRSVVILRI